MSLLFTSCRDCDHLVSAVMSNRGPITLKFESRRICPETLVCRPDSAILDIGRFAAGHYDLLIHVLASVNSDSGACLVTQDDRFEFDIGITPPPPGALPFVNQVHIGPLTPCAECIPAPIPRP